MNEQEARGVSDQQCSLTEPPNRKPVPKTTTTVDAALAAANARIAELEAERVRADIDAVDAITAAEARIEALVEALTAIYDHGASSSQRIGQFLGNIARNALRQAGEGAEGTAWLELTHRMLAEVEAEIAGMEVTT